MSEALAQRLGAVAGAAVQTLTPLRGGDIAAIWRVVNAQSAVLPPQ